MPNSFPLIASGQLPGPTPFRIGSTRPDPLNQQNTTRRASESSMRKDGRSSFRELIEAANDRSKPAAAEPSRSANSAKSADRRTLSLPDEPSHADSHAEADGDANGVSAIAALILLPAAARAETALTAGSATEANLDQGASSGSGASLASASDLSHPQLWLPASAQQGSIVVHEAASLAVVETNAESAAAGSSGDSSQILQQTSAAAAQEATSATTAVASGAGQLPGSAAADSQENGDNLVQPASESAAASTGRSATDALDGVDLESLVTDPDNTRERRSLTPAENDFADQRINLQDGPSSAASTQRDLVTAAVANSSELEPAGDDDGSTAPTEISADADTDPSTARFDLTASGTAAARSSTAEGPVTTSPEMAQRIVHQVADSIVTRAATMEVGDTRTLDAILDPPDLGRLHFRITRSESGLTAVVAAEKGDVQHVIVEQSAFIEKAVRAHLRGDESLQFFAGDTHFADGSSAHQRHDQAHRPALRNPIADHFDPVEARQQPRRSRSEIDVLA